MPEEKKKKPKNLDEVLAELRESSSNNLDQSFKAHDKFSTEENQNHIYNNILAPAHDDLYGAIKGELDKVTQGDDDAKLHGKREEVKRAVTKGLKKYFEKAQPAVAKTVDDLKMDEGEQYEFLTQMYDEHVGAGKIKGVESIRGLEELVKNKKATFGHLKRHLSEQKGEHIKGAMGVLTSKHLTHHFGKYHPVQIAGYLRPHFESAGLELQDKVGYATADLGELIQLRRAIVEKEIHPYFKKKTVEKK